MISHQQRSGVCAILGLLFLSACASTGRHDGSLAGEANVSDDAHYKSGNMKPYTVRGKTYVPRIPKPGSSETGLASWYGNESGNRTATGEIFDADGISAAHRTFPLPSVAEVTNLDNGKSIKVRINDRGPFNDRIIDLSRGAAKALGVYQTGTARVRVTWLGPAAALSMAVPIAAPSAAPSIDDKGCYVVQLGAFSLRDNALALQARIDDAKVDQRGKLYVVFLGPFSGVEKAEIQRQAAIDAGVSGAIVKRED